MPGQNSLPCGGPFPTPKPASHYPTWRFTRDEDLTDLLGRLTREVLLPFAWPLWNDEGRIRALLARQHRETQQIHEREVSRAVVVESPAPVSRGGFAGRSRRLQPDRPADLTAADRRTIAMANRADPESGA